MDKMNINIILRKQKIKTFEEQVVDSQKSLSMSSLPQGISRKPYSKKIRKWLQDLEIMDTNRILKQALQYKPKG
jgi:hypothetical protein